MGGGGTPDATGGEGRTRLGLRVIAPTASPAMLWVYVCVLSERGGRGGGRRTNRAGPGELVLPPSPDLLTVCHLPEAQVEYKIALMWLYQTSSTAPQSVAGKISHSKGDLPGASAGFTCRGRAEGTEDDFIHH